MIVGFSVLNTVSGKQMAALVGVAPLNRDSGRQQGYRARLAEIPGEIASHLERRFAGER